MIHEVNLESLDRTIFELVRLKLVEKGLLPDITAYATLELYEAAKKTWGPILVEVFGVGQSKARDKKGSHRIVIDRKGLAMGTLGGNTTYHEENADYLEGEDFKRFTKKRRPENTFNVNYEIRIITNSTSVDRKLSDVMYSSLGTHRFTKLIEGEVFGTKSALIVYNGDVDVSSTDFIERLFMYMYSDVWLDSTSETLSTSIAPLLEITIKVGDEVTTVVDEE